MKIIDTHVHFWELSNNINTWVLLADKKLQKNFSPNHLNADYFVHIEAADSKVDTLNEINWLDENFSDKKMQYIANIDYFKSLDAFKNEVDRLKKHPKIKGFRHILSHHKNASYSPMDHDNLPNDFEEKLKILAKNNLIFECQMYPQQINNALEIIINSNVKTVIEHFGLPLCHNETDMIKWQKMINNISQHENIYLKLSGFFMLNDNETDCKKALNYIFEKIPASRLCYGSNYPVCNTDHYSYWYELLKDYAPEEMHDDIFYNTAKKIYF